MDKSSARARRAAGALEREILGVLWSADRPLTPIEIQATLDREIAYNTVHTILTRLQDKGLVVRVPLGARSGYAPAKEAAQDAAERMRQVLGTGAERDVILQRFVSSLSPDDEAALRAALDERRPS